MKLLRYSDFILESKQEFLLPTLFSSDFMNRIKNIESDISYELDKMSTYGNSKYKPLSKWSFISVSESNDKIIYTDSSKVTKYISDTYQIVDSNEIINFVKKINFPSYDNHLLNFSRTEMNIGRFIRAFFGTKYSDAQVENFVNQWKSLDESSTFEIWHGSDIGKGYSSKLYHFNHYDNGMNPLMNSCMNDMFCVEFYKYCPDLKLLVLLDKEEAILGRALLWQDIDGRKIMDRIYFVYDKDYYKFVRWANENDFYYKKENGGLNKFIKSGREETIRTEVKILNVFDFPDDEYPYLDTFSYVQGDRAYNYKPEGNYWRFMNTDGTYDVYDWEIKED